MLNLMPTSMPRCWILLRKAYISVLEPFVDKVRRTLNQYGGMHKIVDELYVHIYNCK